MPTEIKICGLSDPDAVRAAVEGGADMIGFVFFPASPRHVAVERAAELAGLARGRAAITALTVDATDSELAGIVAALRPDLLQLHGSETPERTAAIRRNAGTPVMKAVGVAATADLVRARSYFEAADRLLIDAKPPRGASRPGGNGQAFDWALLDGFASPVPWMLSGGLAPANVAEAVARTAAPGVDVSSGVETAPGHKDRALIRAFIRALRGEAEPKMVRRAG